MKKDWFSPARLLMLSTAFAGTLLLASCDKDDDETPVNNMYTISGNGTGAQVVPAFAGTGTGTITGTYDRSSNVLSYNVGWAGITDTATTVGFYKGASGSEGTSAQTLSVSTQGTTGNSTGTLNLTDEQETDLLAGNWYYNIGTLANPTGEVRGQITATQ
ncbi:MAG: CHRD domain-containing protein [Bacteroidota bacterium]